MLTLRMASQGRPFVQQPGAGAPSGLTRSCNEPVHAGDRVPDTNRQAAEPEPSWSVRLEQRSDEDLMLAYQRGDTSAFEALLRRHEKGIFGFAWRQLGSRAQAEEVTQECFLRVITASSRYTARASFRHYLYQIARNLCVDQLRRKAPEVETPSGSGASEILDSIPNGNPGPAAHAGTHRLRMALHRALQHLPPEQREVFLLKEIRDLKLQDVARITGSNLNTVKSRLRYALLGLREQLAREGVGREDGHEM